MLQNPLSDDAAFYKQLFERSHIAKLIIDPVTNQIVEANPAACTLYGYTLKQLTAKRLTDINIMSEGGIRDQVQRVIDKDGTTFQTQHRLASGVICDVEVFACSVEQDAKTYLYAIITDVSEQKRTEKAVRESEALYRLFAHNMPNSSVLMFDTDMRYTLADGPFLKRFGTVYDDLIGKTPQEAIKSPEALDFIVSIYQRALNGESFDYESKAQHLNYKSYVAPIRDDEGQIIGGMVLSHDMTETKQAEEALRASEERLRLITDNIQDLVTQRDAENRIVFASASYRHMLGYEPEDITQDLGRELIHPDDWNKTIAVRQNAINAHLQPPIVEGRLRHADGHYVDVETLAHLVYDSQSNYAGGIFVSREITERKRLQELVFEQEKLQAALEKEHELSNLKTRMMERIAHEFRTPLTVIQSSMETLMSYYERLTSVQRDQKADNVRSQILRITDMLDEIGLVVRGTFTPEGIHCYPTDVSTICGDIAIYLAGYFNLPDKYVLHVPETTVVSVDATLIRTALLHIMRNAGRFSEPPAVVTVDLSRLENSIEIRVSDTGIGILPEELPRIFAPFFRGGNINERSGLGVGLTIARAAVEAQGGSIKVDSVLSQGTIVTLQIPIVA